MFIVRIHYRFLRPNHHRLPHPLSLSTIPLSVLKFEPSHDKTNKMACATSEDSDQPRPPPSLIGVFVVRMKKAWVLSYHLSAQRRLCSDWTDSQDYLSLRWVHSHIVGFVMMLRNGLNRAYCRVFGTFKMLLLMFINILVFRLEGQIWNPVRRDTKTYVRILAYIFFDITEYV